MLVNEEKLLEVLTSTLAIACKKLFRKTKEGRHVIDYNKEAFESDGFWHLLYDLEYVFYDIGIALKFITTREVFQEWLKFLSYLQGSVQIERIDSDDNTWQKAFAIEMRTIPRPIGYMCRSITELKKQPSQNSLKIIQNILLQCFEHLLLYFHNESMKKKTSPNPRVKEIIHFETAKGLSTYKCI